MRFRTATRARGFTMVEVIVVSALSTIIFIVLFSSFIYLIDLIGNSRAKLAAVNLANDRMEYFRSLPYDDVGTVSGIPAGTIPQNSIQTINGFSYNERVLVEYVDDAADGLDLADGNGIPSDYKRVKVEYSWSNSGATSSIFIVSNIVPRSIETTAGGGTVRINVIDSVSGLLPGASVRLINDTTTSTIDVTRTTDANGAALFSGAPASSDYEVEVTALISGDQYSTTGTYEATTTNPIPSVAPFAVLESDISTLTFQIDELSDIELSTFSSITEGVEEETFANGLNIASSSNATTTGGRLVLTDTLGVYDASGVVYLATTTPSSLEQWRALRTVVDLPIGTSYAVRFYTGSAPGPYVLIPNTDLPGNSSGFVDQYVDLSALDPLTYPSIVVGVELGTTNTAITPELNELAVYYRESAVTLPSIAFDVRGSKVIGTLSDLTPIYKYEQTVTTDGTGDVVLPDMEFDTYVMVPPGAYDIAVACSQYPVVHQAGVDSIVDLILVGNAANTLRVQVVDSLGNPLSGADVRLQRSGYDVTQTTNSCGQTFFTGGVTDNSDYTLTTSALGFTTDVQNPFSVSGDTTEQLTLNP